MGIPIDAHIVWARGDTVYLAARDSIAVERAMRLTFVARGKAIAAGEVSEVLDRRMARALVTWGAIGEPRHYNRISVLASPPPRSRLFRIGYPAPTRGAGPFACPPAEISRDDDIQRIEPQGRWLRILRRADSTGLSPWPDTLSVQTFADAADEEIALERGEIDVGVFWPGERSAHLRDHPRYRDPLTWSPASPYLDCAVVCDPAVRSQAAAIGARAFVELYRCPGDGR